MSVASAVNPLISETPDVNSELARRCLYYMKMMREMEDRIERKLYRQGTIVGGGYAGPGPEASPFGAGLRARPADEPLPPAPDLALVLTPSRTPHTSFRPP